MKRLHTSAPLAAILLLAGCGKSLDGEYLNATAVMSSTSGETFTTHGMGHSVRSDGGRRPPAQLPERRLLQPGE